MAKEKVINGVNVDQLFSTIESIKANPEIARFKFRATNQWIEGTHNRATVKDFYGVARDSPLIAEWKPTREAPRFSPLAFNLNAPELHCHHPIILCSHSG